MFLKLCPVICRSLNKADDCGYWAMARKKYTWGSQQWNSVCWRQNWVVGLVILEYYFEEEEEKKKKQEEEEEEEEKKGKEKQKKGKEEQK